MAEKMVMEVVRELEEAEEVAMKEAGKGEVVAGGEMHLNGGGKRKWGGGGGI